MVFAYLRAIRLSDRSVQTSVFDRDAFIPAFSGLLHTEGVGAAKQFAQEAFAVMAFIRIVYFLSSS